MRFLYKVGNHYVSRHSAPYLRFDYVPAIAHELLDPFEEQFDMPAALAECCDGQRRQDEVAAQEDERLAAFDIFESNATQDLWIMLRVLKPAELHPLISNNAGQSIDLRRTDT